MVPISPHVCTHFSNYHNVIMSRCFQSIRPTYHAKVPRFSPCMYMCPHFSNYHKVIMSRCFQSIQPVKVPPFSSCMYISPFTTLLSRHDVFKVYGLCISENSFCPMFSTSLNNCCDF